MLSFLPAPLVGLIAFLLYCINTAVIPLLVIILALFTYILPVKAWRQKCSRFTHEVLPDVWVHFSNFIIFLTIKTEWDVQGTGELSKEGWYFLICNHQSWLDIIVLERVFAHKTPILKFFMKRQLLWALPVAGVACWLLGFPFVKRYSKEYLEKHPEKAGKDLEITKKACEKFKDQPIAIINYIEGGRFTAKKHAGQASPYKHLLKPKAGGFAFVLSALQQHLHCLINVTIIYPENTSLWRFMCGKVDKIIVRYEAMPISAELIGDYYHDKHFRDQIQHQLNQLWAQKDQLIDDIKKQERL